MDKLWICMWVIFISGVTLYSMYGHSMTSLNNHNLEVKVYRLEQNVDELEKYLYKVDEIRYLANRYDIAPKWSKLIIKYANKHDIPKDLAFRLVKAESNFNPDAVSVAGAVGLAQVMYPTALDMKPDITYTELFDPEINLDLGLRYLGMMLATFGDTALALSAYNGGPSNVRRGWRNYSYERSILE